MAMFNAVMQRTVEQNKQHNLNVLIKETTIQ